jgi:hypothetical protein
MMNATNGPEGPPEQIAAGKRDLKPGEYRPGVSRGATSWEDVADVLAKRGGTPIYRYGNRRSWRIPSPTGGSFEVEVTLRPRWCAVAVDRWPTTGRIARFPAAWFEANAWPLVRRALDAKGNRSLGFLPVGTGPCSSASPIDRNDVLELLAGWVDHELLWGVPREEVTEFGSAS